MFESTKTKAAAAVLALLVVVGIGTWIYQLMFGLGVTGMNNSNSWGLYITMFMFFVGLSAGGLIVASSASVFHIEKFKSVALPAVITSTVCICLAGMFVLIDLGGIQRVWIMFASPNFASPLLWDVCVITLYLIINIVYLVFMKKYGVNSIQVSRVSRVALPVAILVHSVTAWIFGLQIAKEGWYSAIMAPIFVASAMDSGLALLLLVLFGLAKAKIIEFASDLMSSLSGLLATCIAIDAFFIGCEVLTMAYPGGEGAQTLAIMVTGSTAPFFWAEIICGLLIPFCILVFAKNRQNKTLVIVSSVLVVLGVLCKRIWLLFTSFVMPNIEGAPGISLGSTAAQSSGADMWTVLGTYAPTTPEIIITIGVVALGVLAVMVMSKKLLCSSESKVKGSAAEAVEA